MKELNDRAVGADGMFKEMKRNVLSVIALLIIIVLCAAGCSGKDNTSQQEPTQATTEGTELPMPKEVAAGYLPAENPTNFIDIQMDSGAHIVIELDENQAPLTVKNFKKLVGESFYDGIIFHRIISGFMIQGGDPEGKGTGGSKDSVKGEFSSNGVNNTLSHARGVVSMARTPVPDSASSQFFICHGDSKFLDGDYAAFGRVVCGMDEVDRIASLTTDARDFPKTPPVMTRVFFVTPES